uniref:Prolactin receptor n=1 Tax=Gongylonema pulchrum TaxID=637853 RepID=A0A183E5X2_9BILA
LEKLKIDDNGDLIEENYAINKTEKNHIWVSPSQCSTTEVTENILSTTMLSVTAA